MCNISAFCRQLGNRQTMEWIAEKTNLYSQENLGKLPSTKTFKVLITAELLGFLGISIIVLLHTLPDLKMYWRAMMMHMSQSREAPKICPWSIYCNLFEHFFLVSSCGIYFCRVKIILEGQFLLVVVYFVQLYLVSFNLSIFHGGYVQFE